MSDRAQFDPDRIRVVLDRGEVVELDGGTLVLDGEQSPSVVLRLAPYRARSVALMLHEWSSKVVKATSARPSSSATGDTARKVAPMQPTVRSNQGKKGTTELTRARMITGGHNDGI